MPSRADWRRAAEWVARVALVLALVVALWRSARASGAGTTSVSMQATQPGDALLRASTSEHVGAVDVEVDGALSAPRLAWLAALRHAGVQVSWNGSPPALAVATD